MVWWVCVRGAVLRRLGVGEYGLFPRDLYVLLYMGGMNLRAGELGVVEFFACATGLWVACAVWELWFQVDMFCFSGIYTLVCI